MDCLYSRRYLGQRVQWLLRTRQPESVPGSTVYAEIGPGKCKADLGIDAPNTSSTYQYIKSNASFDDGYGHLKVTDNVTGDWVSDTVRIGGVDVTSLQFGVAYNTSVTRT